jgi:hypothetical protein
MVIDWEKNAPQTLEAFNNFLVIRVRPTSSGVEQKVLFSDRRITFSIWYSQNSSKLTGYALQFNQPEVKLLKENYFGLFFSKKPKKFSPHKPPLQIIYEDQTVRLLSFGQKFVPKDYLLVARWHRR